MRFHLFLKCLIWIVCFVIIIPLAIPQGFRAYSASDQSDSSLSAPASAFGTAFGLTKEQFEQKVKQYLGIPYLRAGTSRKGMDCSSFVRIVYNKFFGIKVPYTAAAQFDSSRFKKINSLGLQPGDLIFFDNNNKKRIDHVGMYVSDGCFIHATSSLGITISSLDNHYWKKRIVESKRHTGLTYHKPNFNQFKFEGSLAVPLFENGEIQIHGGNDLCFTTAQLQDELDPFEEVYSQNYERHISLRPFYAMGYTHNLSDGLDMRLSAVHETFNLSDFTLSMASRSPSFSRLDTLERTGIRLAGDFSSGSWLSVTPAITYFDYSKEDEYLLNIPEWSLGLNTLVSPAHRQWALSMLLEYSQGDGSAGVKTSDSRFTSLDMELKFWINLRDNLEFSIAGQHDMQDTADELSKDPMFIQSGSSNLFMMFKYLY